MGLLKTLVGSIYDGSEDKEKKPTIFVHRNGFLLSKSVLVFMDTSALLRFFMGMDQCLSQDFGWFVILRISGFGFFRMSDQTGLSGYLTYLVTARRKM